MKTDVEIKGDVLAELAWQANIDETKIGVIVEYGIVSLSGIVNDYSKKIAVEKAVKNVAGVKAVTLNIEVKYNDHLKKTDKEIAKAIVDSFEWNSSIPEKDITTKVDNGWVYLSGEVQWPYQKEAAKKAIEDLLGVKNIINTIILKNGIKPIEVKSNIQKAFNRLATLNANGIVLETQGHSVTLRGKVHSIKEKEDAESAAYNAPGVFVVKNELKVEYFTGYA